MEHNKKIIIDGIKDYCNSSEFVKVFKDFDLKNSKISLLAQGEYNVNYLIEDNTRKKLVFRYSTKSQRGLKRQIAYEYNALEKLEKSGRTPKVYVFNEDRKYLPFDFLIMEYLKGRPLVYKSDLKEAANILSDIHSLKPELNHGLIESFDSVEEILEESKAMLKKYKDSVYGNSSLINHIEKNMEIAYRKNEYFKPLKIQRKERPSYVNTELNSGNFLINPKGKSYLIDWEKPLISDPLQDLAHFLAPTTTFWKTDVILKDEEKIFFIESYCNLIPLNKEELEYLTFLTEVTCFRGITWCAMAYVEYKDTNRPIKNEDTFKKIEQYLSPEFYTKVI